MEDMSELLIYLQIWAQKGEGDWAWLLINRQHL